MTYKLTNNIAATVTYKLTNNIAATVAYKLTTNIAATVTYKLTNNIAANYSTLYGSHKYEQNYHLLTPYTICRRQWHYS